MRHDWIFDVLSDLQDYATQNDLPELALKVDEAMSVARREIETAGGTVPDAVPLTRRAH
jgi:hypothetical protein